MRLAAASSLVAEWYEIFRCDRATGATLSSRNVNDRVERSTTGIVVVVTVVLVVVLVVVVVVLPAPGKLAGSAGLVPWSSSVRSKNPSRSRSTPMRRHQPGGPQGDPGYP